MPRFGEKYDIDIETISKPRAEYTTAGYLESGLPTAPAIMIGSKIVTQGFDISEKKMEAVICKHLGLNPPESVPKKLFSKLLRR